MVVIDDRKLKPAVDGRGKIAQLFLWPRPSASSWEANRWPGPSQKGPPLMATLIRRHYTATDPRTGRKVRRASKKWYAQYVDAAGVRQRVPLSANKTAAQQMLNELVRKAELAKVGILDPFEVHSK